MEFFKELIDCICRASSVAALGPRFQILEDQVNFQLKDIEKNSRVGKVRGEIKCPNGAEHPPLSLASYLPAYMDRTKEARKYFASCEGHEPERLFIANVKPYQPVTPSTLARWLLQSMADAGIDTTSYRAHSARSAAASSLVRRGLSLPQILQRANWSEKSRTFEIFYNRA